MTRRRISAEARPTPGRRPELENLYSENFFLTLRAASNSSARVVVPLIQKLANPHSVLDVGCGVGSWASVWIESGCADVIGVDGDYVDLQLLEIPADRFIAHDLTTPLRLDRRFDLVMCLEVAEHLPEDAAQVLVESLVRHADIVVFSAAIPGQGGTGHINEQWPSYWAGIFDRYGYGVHDPLRGAIWDDDSVEFWYRQNCLVFASSEYPGKSALPAMASPIDIVHPALFRTAVGRPAPLSTRLAENTVAVRRKFGRTRMGHILRKIRTDVRHGIAWGRSGNA